ncbi:MAG: ABC transporter substrate-binding protein [Clostridiales bacterium]|nr:ABC transporter substrate-binding protein [Clostridiales bacterium]
MKKIFAALLCAAVLCSLCGCGAAEEPAQTKGVVVTDIFGDSAVLNAESRVAFGYTSFAQCWQLAGGEPLGVTLDAVEDRGMDLPEEVEIIGTVKSVDLEKLIALSPDYVVLSADLTAHTELKDSLREMGIPCGYFRVDTFDDYKSLMVQFCAVTGRDDLFEQNVTRVEENISSIRVSIPEGNGESVLLLRAYSTGVRAKTDDNLAGQILREFHMENIADKSPSLLEELSMEQIILEDPRYIFVTTMGDEQAAEEYMRLNMESDPAWSSLTAVKEGRYIFLPQDLFHYKPNERWDESYEYLAKIIYPEIFG